MVSMLEMSSSGWLSQCEDLGFSEDSPYTSARPGYLLMNKGRVREGGSQHISKLGTKALLIEWYHKDNDPRTIFRELLIELENHIVTNDAEAVLYQFSYKGKKYNGLFMSAGSQVSFLLQVP